MKPLKDQVLARYGLDPDQVEGQRTWDVNQDGLLVVVSSSPEYFEPNYVGRSDRTSGPGLREHYWQPLDQAAEGPTGTPARPTWVHAAPGLKRGGFAASTAQRVKVATRACANCGQSPVDPAHIIPRSLGGCDERECVLALCRPCHTQQEAGSLDLLPVLERDYRAELAHAVTHLGLLRTLQQVTGQRWAPAEKVAA